VRLADQRGQAGGAGELQAGSSRNGWGIESVLRDWLPFLHIAYLAISHRTSWIHAFQDAAVNTSPTRTD